MAQKLLLNVLVQVLGEFVEGLSEENLKLGVWSGKIVLQNLELNRTSIQKLNLPVSVANGCVKRVEISIPWTSLESQPVKVDMSGIFLQVGPVVVTNLDPMEVSARALENKRHKLEALENLVLPDDDEKSGSSRSYVQRLTAKIIDNLEIRLHNMHIRYEDSQTIPGKVFSAGITVDSFVVATTNKDWVESFVARTESACAEAIHKLATMTNLTIYWNANCEVMAGQPSSQWQYNMDQMVYSSRNKLTEQLDYLLAPPNQLSVKLTHNEYSVDGVPKFDAVVESTLINFHVDKRQYHQVMITKNQFALAERMQRLFLRRPFGRPSRSTAKEWWLYAVIRVLNRENIGSQSAWLNFQRCVQYRRRYIDLIVKSKRMVPNPKTPTESIPAINSRENGEIIDIEKLLPFEALVVYRQLAAVEARRERLKAAIDNPIPKPASTSWFSWGRSSSAKAAEEELVTIEKIKAELDRGFNISSIPSTQLTWRFVLRSSGVLSVTSDDKAIAKAKMAMTIESEMIGSGGIMAKFSLDELKMKDLYTPTPLFPYLVKVPSTSAGSAKLVISFDSKDGVSNVRVDALPLEIVWNKPCIQQILDIVSVPKLETIIEMSDTNLLAAYLAPKKKKKNEDGEMNFIFEADAPKILIPDDCSSDCGFLFLDAGRLSVRGQMKGEEGMSWKVALTSINANMPSTLSQAHCLDKKKNVSDEGVNGVSAYLIRPFNFAVDVQTFDNTNANMTVDVFISPGVKADLDAVKLARVLEFSSLVSSTFNSNETPQSDTCSNRSNGTGSYGSDLVPLEISRAGARSAQKQIEEDSDAVKHNIIVKVVVPVVSLDLHYDTVKAQHIVLAATDLCTVVKTRMYDFQASFTMNSMSIEDSSRSASQREIAWTRANVDDDNLVYISYTDIKHKRSPLFNGYGSEINVTFGSIFMISDTKTLMHIRPFYEVLLGKRFKPIRTMTLDIVKDRLPHRRNQQRTAVNAPTLASKPKGTHILCTLGKIRLELLKSKAGDVPYVSAMRSDSPDAFCGRSRSRSVGSNGSVYHDSMPPIDDLESVVALEVTGLCTEVFKMELIESKVTVHSFEIFDTREISEDYEFRTLFRPDFNLADNLKPSTPGNVSGEGHSSELSLTERKSQGETINETPPKRQQKNNLLELVYLQLSKENSVVNINIGNVTSFFSLDIILELVNVAVENSLAVVALVAAVETGSADVPSESQKSILKEATEVPEPLSNVMTVCVVAPNLRLILLEDPTLPDTRAVVGRCGIDVQYSREVSNGAVQEINESLHVSVLKAEIFVMMTMLRWNPLQILEPVELELHYKRSQEQGVILLTSIALDVDAIDARVSLNDLILAKAIVARGLMSNSGHVPAHQTSTPSPFLSDDNSTPAMHITTYNVHLSLGEISLVVVNDFNGQNLPIIKVLLQGTTFSADGAVQNFNGKGSLILAVDYFNPKVFAWEPVLEPWFPALVLNTGTHGTSIDVSQAGSEGLQLSISGTMLETFLRTYSLLLQADDVTERIAAPAVTFQNLLGVPIEIFDGDKKLLELLDDGIVPVSRLQAIEHGHGSGLVRTNAQSAKTFSIGFLDKMKEDRRPVLNLPVHVSKPHAYQILPLRPQSDQSNTNPVVEEVYEMERYQPLSGSWKTPFMMNDPPQWATVNYIPRDIAEISLPAEGGWEWQGQWTVEIAPQPKKGDRTEPETDAAGWEYAANFSALSSTSRRRGVSQTFDYVRRRRWIRTRVPSFKNGSDDIRPLTLFWDVQLLPTGCRRILIRSGFQIRNTLSISIFVKLISRVYNSEFVFGPIDADGTFSVPIMYASSSSFSIRPDDEVKPFDWSQQLQCSQNATDYERTFDVCCSRSKYQAVYFKAMVSQVEKSTMVVLKPVFNLENRLPCHLKFRVVTEVSQTDQDPSSADEGFLEAGMSVVLYHIADAERARISISVGNLCWSPFVYLVGGRSSRVPIGVPTQLGPPGLYLIMKIEKGRDNVEQILIGSQAALVDRSNLGICVKSIFKDNREFVRCSAAHNVNDTGPTTTSIRFVAEDPKSEEIVSILKFSCKSNRTYVLATGRHGDFVYIDNNFVWTYLPDYFFGHTCIRTASSDRQMRFKELMEFQVDRKSMIFVLHDSHANAPPKWISSGGFHKIIEQAIARHVVNGVVIEHHYSIFGKIEEPGVNIVLGQNSATSSSADMYSVFILPDIYEKLRDQLLFENNIQRDDASNSWADGANGLSLFNYYDNSVYFGVRGGEYWSRAMHMKNITSGKAPFEIVDTRTNRAYQLCYSVQAMPGKFHRTNLTTVMPRYCIVNCMDEPIEVRQVGTRRTTYVPSFHTEGWHKAEADKTTQIQIKTNSTIWSLGSVDINEIGSTVFLLPLVDGHSAFDSENNEVVKDPVIAHVEVKLAESNENCAVTVIIWREEIDAATAYSVRNDSSHPVVFQQSNVNFSGMRPEVISKFELCVASGKRIPFGWTDPNASSSVTIAVGKHLLSAGKRAAEISFLETGKALRISGRECNKEVIMCVAPEGSGKVLHIVDKPEDLSLVQKKVLAKSSLNNLVVKMLFKRLSVSLVLDRPFRRELFCLHFKKVVTKVSFIEGVSSTEVFIDDYQMDNYSETAVYPVLIYCLKPNPKDIEDGDTSAVKFCMVKVNSKSSTQHYRYFALRVLPVAIEIDSATLEIIADDLLKSLNVVSRDEALATYSPHKWIQEFNTKLLSLEQRRQLVDVYFSQKGAQEQKMFLENFILHPMRVQLSFQKTRFPRDRETNLTDFITAFASVDRMDIKLSSFIVENAMESAATLKSRIVAKLGQDIQSQIAKIAGSLSIIGSPAGFVRNVGNGVEAFFYEPAQGLVQGPQDFVIGIGKGTSSLVSGVVSGALNSTAGVIRNVSSGLSLLSGDSAYIEDRNKNRQQQTRGGMASSLMGGGESVISGFTSGVSGLFTKPYEEAKKDGALGFVRGVGLGVFGAAVKPVIGVTDGISQMAQGISNELSDGVERKYFRPPRAFSRSEADPTELVLTKLDIDAAYGQALVKSKVAKSKIDDSFVCIVVLDKKDDTRVILSENFVFWNISRDRLWTKPWSAISHCTVTPPLTIGLVVYESSGRNETVPIKCRNIAIATELYTALARNAFRMGNPGDVLSVADVFGSKPVASDSDTSPTSKINYRFGSANFRPTIPLPQAASLSTIEVISRATERLQDTSSEDWAHVDRICWSMLQEWSQGHNGLSAARCSLLLLVNNSAEPIQIKRTQLIEGKFFYVVPGLGYNEGSKSIKVGGCVVFFGVANASAIEYGYLSFNVSTSSAEIYISSEQSASYCENLHDARGGFLEKSVSDWWSKYVICITK